jgi:hypothetical protein
MYAIIIICILLIVILWPYESFTTKPMKAKLIYKWFYTHPRPTYYDYRYDLGNISNIVEYEDMIDLVHNGNLNINEIQKYI